MKYWNDQVWDLFMSDSGIYFVKVLGSAGWGCIAISIIAIIYGACFVWRGRGPFSIYLMLAFSPAVIGSCCGFLNLVRGLWTISWFLSENAEGVMVSFPKFAEAFAERLYIGFIGCGLSIFLILFGVVVFIGKKLCKQTV